uniref:Uncharacterized protein n=1 Tax=Rhodnius prolixus TaxID=13249 RepID=T1I5C2_RHOPR
MNADMLIYLFACKSMTNVSFCRSLKVSLVQDCIILPRYNTIAIKLITDNVFQGKLSKILNYYIDSRTLFLNCLGGGLSINRMRCQMFADDIVLLAFDPLILQNMINRLDKGLVKKE